jgi:hypothetical protein
MLDWRLKAYRALAEMEEVRLGQARHPADRLPGRYYYAAPKAKPKLASSTRSIPKSCRTYEKLGIPIEEQKVLAGVEGARKVAVDAVFDSVSVATTFREELKKAGVIFLSISEAIREHPELVKKISRLGRAAARQLFRLPQQRGLLRRHLRLRARGRALPDGAVDLFPHQRREHRPVRAHPDRRRQGQLRLLPRRLHRADARREPAARRGGRDLRARGRRDQILDRPELVSGRRRKARAASSTSSPSARCSRRPLEGQLDPGRDRLARSPGNIRAAS